MCFDEVGIACVRRIKFGECRGRQIISKRIGAVFLANVKDGLGGSFDGGTEGIVFRRPWIRISSATLGYQWLEQI